MPAAALVALSLLAVGACATTDVQDRLAVGRLPIPTSPSADAAPRTLVVITTALPRDLKQRPQRTVEALAAAHAAVATSGSLRPVLSEAAADPALGDEAWLAEARRLGIERVLLLVVDDYSVEFAVKFGLPRPGISVVNDTQVGVRIRLLDSASGNVLVDGRRRRITGGAFAFRGGGDLAGELIATLRSMLEPFASASVNGLRDPRARHAPATRKSLEAGTPSGHGGVGFPG